ncbi:hypothetical protein LIER_09173 [Lithospermum erythrorhizon]|uniref:DC1 domain-containing protein n=1 Tax=Lithospermum erythrorhizon TaxID=34254 RepID=A0AAV3PFZ9_LITER
MKNQNNQHFSHPHILHQFELNEQKSITCNACMQNITTTKPFHGCHTCNFHLHSRCLKAPRHLNHPSHTSHPLTLHPIPTYSSKSFTCNACGSYGNGFSYSCAACEFDLHLHCAFLPTSLPFYDHDEHVLTLFLKSPYDDINTEFYCSICNGLKDNSLWSYYCEECDYGTHLECARTDDLPSNNSEDNGTRSRIEDMKAIGEAREEMDALQLQLKIEAKGRKFALDLWDSPRRRRYYDSDDDDY